jgi:hypothetical protein
MSLAEQKIRSDAPERRKSRAPAAFVIGWIAAWGALIGPGKALCQSIAAPAPQTIAHNGGDAPQLFSEVAWQLTSGLDALGYTAQWNCGPFQHTGRATLKADCKLDVRVLASGGSANWSITAPSDQTNYFGGDQTAVVAAQSFAVGDGEIGLTVTFLNNDFSRLGAGNYTVTVTGTIAAN